MKKLSLIMGIVMMMAMTQCKKAESISTVENESGKVFITLNVENDSRNIIHPETGGAFFSDGDKVFVANNGHYVGTLTYYGSNRQFSGSIDENASTSDYLHFYFMGNKDLEEGTPGSSTTTLTVNISDQSQNYPQIAYAHSSVKYTVGMSEYKARLLNKCGIVKFTAANVPTNMTLTINGMNNKVSVDLSDNSFEYSKEGNGSIQLHAESNTERWAILLPQDEVSNVTAVAGDGTESSAAFTVPEIYDNAYLYEGINVGIKIAIEHLFSVGPHKKVVFSKGNLQYQGYYHGHNWGGEWRFAEHQFDFAGGWYWDDDEEETTDWVDLFGWGTWTVDSPISPLETGSSGGGDTPYDMITNSTPSITNDSHTDWRTLTLDELGYLLGLDVSEDERGRETGCGDYSNTPRSEKWGYAYLSEHQRVGIIVLPDDWNAPTGCTFTPGYDENHSQADNTYDNDNWEAMEEEGAIFLPFAGYRDGDDVDLVNQYFAYWTATRRYQSTEYSSYGLVFYPGIMPTVVRTDRGDGMAVRLVRVVEE